MNSRNIIKSESRFKNNILPDHIILNISKVPIIKVKKSMTIVIPFSVRSHGKGKIETGSTDSNIYNRIFSIEEIIVSIFFSGFVAINT